MTDKEWFDSAQEKCTRTDWWEFVHSYLQRIGWDDTR
jgi:hypothetical protein